MKVTVSSRTSLLDDTMREDIRGRIFYALSRFSPRIGQVTVQIGVVGGTHGNSKRLCRLSVRMNDLGSFLVEAVEDETVIAVSWAAERAARKVLRILDCQRDGAKRKEQP